MYAGRKACISLFFQVSVCNILISMTTKLIDDRLIIRCVKLKRNMFITSLCDKKYFLKSSKRFPYQTLNLFFLETSNYL